MIIDALRRIAFRPAPDRFEGTVSINVPLGNGGDTKLRSSGLWRSSTEVVCERRKADGETIDRRGTVGTGRRDDYDGDEIITAKLADAYVGTSAID